MASQEFTVLYTHQKTKKAKTWQDGVLRIRAGRNQATLFDDKGQCLESIFLKSQVAAGDNLESERYLITVEEAKVSEKPLEDQPRKAETPAVDRNGVIPGLLPPRHLPVGLKRKFTGFQGPRQVEKKIPAVEEEEKPTLLPLSKQCQGTFPSQFYVTSPLFSTIHKKDADTNLSAGFQEDGWRGNAREHLSVSSLLSAPFPDRCEGTEKQSPAQLLVKPESPLLTGQTGPRAVSHNIRSTAQILALLKSKPAQGHGEQTPALTQSLSRFQAAKNADLCDQKSTALPAFPGDAAKGIVPNTQHLPFRKGTVNDRKDWNAEMPLNSPEQPFGEETTGQRHDKKSPGSRSLQGDDLDVIREGNFQMEPDVMEESRINQSPLAFHVCPEVPAWTMAGSPSHSALRQAQWTSWEPGKISSELPSSFDPDSTVSPPSGNEESIGDIQEPLIQGILPREPELPDVFFTGEKSSYPEECSLPRSKATLKTRTPFVTLPATEEIPGAFYPTDSEFPIPVEFPMSAPGPEDRNCETAVFGEYTEDGQRESVQPLLPKVTSQHRRSKWLKYQNSAQSDLIPHPSDDREETADICAQSILGMLQGDTGESGPGNQRAPGAAPLLISKSSPGECCASSTPPDWISEGKLLSPHLSQTPLAAATQKVLSHLSCHAGTGEGQDIRISELSFPSGDKVKRANLPKRTISIPAVFRSHIHYKQIFKAALTEQLNVMLFELSQRLHNALSKVDISFYTSVKDGQSQSQGSCAPLCNHMHPAKLVMVKKEGQNKGRLFYACDAPKAEQCSFFKWIEDVNPTQAKSRPSAVLHDVKSIGTYLRSQRIALYEECQLLVRKAFEIQTQKYSKFKKFMNTPASLDGDSKPKLYLKLSKKEHSSLYSKDDIWVVSKTLNFDPIDTFIASSAFFGPSSNNEIELLPLKGYSPSNWRSNMCVHALLVCNASGELASLRNMEEHFNPSTFPLIPYLLNMNFRSENAPKRVDRRKFTPPAMRLKSSVMAGPVSSEVATGLAEEMIQRFSLNPDQAASLLHIARMMSSCGNITAEEEQQSPPITIIRGTQHRMGKCAALPPVQKG